MLCCCCGSSAELDVHKTGLQSFSACQCPCKRDVLQGLITGIKGNLKDNKSTFSNYARWEGCR